MNRRWIFKVLAAAAVAVPLADRRAAAAGEKKAHRLALHVDQNDADVMKLALNNARNAYDLYKERGEEVAIEIVAYSQGLHMLRDDTSPVKAEIRELRKKVPQVASLRDHEMMRRVMAALNHDAYEAERLELDDLPRVSA